MSALIRSIPILLAAVALGACGDSDHPGEATEHAGSSAAEGQDGSRQNGDGEREVLYWYDPMVPEQHFDEPGPSPFMDMDLVPRYADEVEPGQVRVARGIQQLMNIRTAEAERGRLSRRIDSVGHVDYDPDRLHHFHPRVEGWIKHLGVTDEGDVVRRGQTLFTLDSPELVNAQEEFLHALRRGEPGRIRAARDKLGALDVQAEAIEHLEKTREVRRALPWLARHDSVVTRLGVRHGMYVTPGTEVMELADLSRLWVIADVFDRHADWLAPGQAAEITTSYDAGPPHQAEISHVYPLLDETTRTVRVRLPVDNADGRLKPGMWASVRIFAGYVDDLVIIPREALIRTGHGARVVLREDEHHFRVREVMPGMESGGQVAIRNGLAPGETVVVSGQFLIDSEASLRDGYNRLEHDH